jgi:hypothetical protein
MAKPTSRMITSRRVSVITCMSRSPTTSSSENHATTPVTTPSAKPNGVAKRAGNKFMP